MAVQHHVHAAARVNCTERDTGSSCTLCSAKTCKDAVLAGPLLLSVSELACIRWTLFVGINFIPQCDNRATEFHRKALAISLDTFRR
eukprot:5212372-Amphidinium_carterae.1